MLLTAPPHRLQRIFLAAIPLILCASFLRFSPSSMSLSKKPVASSFRDELHHLALTRMALDDFFVSTNDVDSEFPSRVLHESLDTLEIQPPPSSAAPATRIETLLSKNESVATFSSSNSQRAPREPARFAYVSLMANVDESRRYQVYMSGILVIAKRLRRLQSEADFLVILTIKDGSQLTSLPAEDLALLHEHGVEVRPIPAEELVWAELFKANRASIPDAQRAEDKLVMYSKLFAWQFTEYESIQFMDADCMPSGKIGNMMDRYFHELPHTTFIRGWMSPLQGGWYLLKPSRRTFEDLVELVRHRYSSAWDGARSFDLREEQPRGKGPCLDDDQGLFWCYFRYAARAPPIAYVDHRNTRINEVQAIHGGRVVSRHDRRSGGGNFSAFLWEHFGGRFKPWRVCTDPKLVSSLPAIATKHRSHWPPTKLANFKVYCDVFRELPASFRQQVKSHIKPPG